RASVVRACTGLGDGDDRAGERRRAAGLGGDGGLEARGGGPAGGLRPPAPAQSAWDPRRRDDRGARADPPRLPARAAAAPPERVPRRPRLGRPAGAAHPAAASRRHGRAMAPRHPRLLRDAAADPDVAPRSSGGVVAPAAPRLVAAPTLSAMNEP